MIDFKNSSIIKLKKVDDAKFDGSMKGATNRNLDMRISGETTLYVTTVKAY